MFLLKLILAGVCASAAVYAGNTATQTVSFSILAINEIAVSSPTVTLGITTATAGSAPTAASDASTTYAITTNQTGQKITGAINTAMPTDTALQVSLAAPAGATSAGSVSLSTTAANLVTGITTLASLGNTITYNFSAAPTAGNLSSTSRTVTLTLTAGP